MLSYKKHYPPCPPRQRRTSVDRKNSGEYRRDCSLSAPSMRFSALSLALNLPPLSKGGGLTERHKLLLCCFLLVIRLPFQFIKLFCRQDGGIAIQSFASHYPSRFSSGEGLCVLVWLRICIIPPTFRRVRVCVCLAGFASLQSLWAFISGILALLAPPVAPNASIPTTIAK